MLKHTIKSVALLLMSASTTAAYPEFMIHKADIRNNEPIAKRHLSGEIACGGQNVSPLLRWTSGPEGTKGYAVTAVDRDSEVHTRYHWIVLNIPRQWSGIPRGLATTSTEQGILQIRTDWGYPGWYGPSAASGQMPRRYVFTVYALNVSKLHVPSDAEPSIAGEAIARHVIAASSVTAIHPSWRR